MIKLNELRLGNLVKGKDGDFIIVDSIVTAEGAGINAGVSYNGCIPDYDSKEVFGIPLTVEILIKYGYKNTEGWEKDLYTLNRYTEVGS